MRHHLFVLLGLYVALSGGFDLETGVMLRPFIFFVLSYLVRIIVLYLYSVSILYYRHLPLTGHPYLPEITEISILSSLTAKYLYGREGNEPWESLSEYSKWKRVEKILSG